MKNAKYSLIIKESGDVIEDYATLIEAEKGLLEAEAEDKRECNYTDNYYEIYNNNKEEVIS